MGVRGRRAARRAEEGEAPEPRHVERRQHGGQGQHREDRPVVRPGQVEDRVLREESREERQAADRGHPDREGHERELHPPGEPAQLENILLVVAAVDDGAGAEEEQRLEEGVGRQVEHGRADAGGDHQPVLPVRGDERAEPEGRDHVAELGERGVGQDLLDVALDEGAERGVERGGGADPKDDGQRLRDHQDVDPAEHVDAGRDHRGGVDQGGDGRRALHRVGQPDLERELGGLAHRPAEQQQRDQPAEHMAVAEGGEVDGAVGPVAEDDAEQEAEVAHAVRDERLLGRLARRGLLVPVADQQPGAEPHQLPKDEHHEKIVGQHQAEHREHEHRQAAEVPAPGRVVTEVAERKHVHAQADHGDDHEHQRREVVELEAERERERAQLQPGPRNLAARPAQGEEGRAGQDEDGGRHGHHRGERARAAQDERDDRGRGQRREEDEEGERNGRHGGGVSVSAR